MLEELKEFLSIPSISVLLGHRADVIRCAEFSAGQMRTIGMTRVSCVTIV